VFYKTKIFLAVITSKLRSGKGKRMRGNFTLYSVNSIVFMMEISTLENETITLSRNVKHHKLTQ